jgi:cobyrinic acid a,c-diamide synthase
VPGDGRHDGNVFPMTGCLPFATRMLDRLKALGYREVTQTQATVLGPAGQVMRGHEFHYSAIAGGTVDANGVYRMTDRTGMEKAPRVCGGSDPGQLCPSAFRQLPAGRHSTS